MKLLLHTLSLGLIGLYSASVAILLFLEGASYQTLFLLPIPLVYLLALLARRISVGGYVIVGAAATALLVFGRWTLDAWLRAG